MSRTGILISLGILSMLAPFSGLPVALRTLLTVAFGAGVLIVGLSLRRSEVPPETQYETQKDTPPPAIG